VTKPILLNDLLHLSQEELKRTKVKFNLHGGGTRQIDVFLRNQDTVNNDALFYRGESTRYFKVGEIAISLIQMSSDTWLLATIKEVTNELGVTHGVNYEGKEIETYKPLFGRTIIKYHKKSQQAVRYVSKIADELEVLQILPNIFDGEDFPGYDKVRLSYEQLSAIVKKRKQDWVAVLDMPPNE